MDELGAKNKEEFNPFLIGICGGSASGKTTAASYITQFVGEENCLLFSLDNYFLGQMMKKENISKTIILIDLKHWI